VFAIAKVFAVCGLVRHVSPLKGLENLTPVEDWLDVSVEKPGCNFSLRLTGALISSVRVKMRNDIENLPIAPCHFDG
jgi:hypothetical protein